MEIREPGTHLDHFLRQTRSQLTQFSAMADMKANMLLTIASVVVTLSAPHVLEPHLKAPLIVLIAACLVTILLASYAAMPRGAVAPAGRRGPDAVASPGFNLLFFGDFARMSYEDFEAAMAETMNDAGHTYGAQVKELYLAGTYLARKKYRFLQLAYAVFMSGIAIGGATLLVQAGRS